MYAIIITVRFAIAHFQASGYYAMAGLDVVQVLAHGLRAADAAVVAAAADAAAEAAEAAADAAKAAAVAASSATPPGETVATGGDGNNGTPQPPAPSSPSSASTARPVRVGLVHTIKHILLRCNHIEPHIMHRMLNAQLPPPPPPPAADAADETINGDTPTAPQPTFLEALLELLLADAPDDIAPLMLRNAVLRDAAAPRLCAAIQTKQRRTVEDRFCLLWMTVRQARRSSSGDANASGALEDDDDDEDDEQVVELLDGLGENAVEVMWRRRLYKAGSGPDFEPGELCALLVHHWQVMFESPRYVPMMMMMMMW